MYTGTAAILFISLMLTTLGGSRPSNKVTEQLTKKQLEHNVDSAVLLSMLAKLMRTIDEDALIQETLCHPNLTLTNLKELLNSATTNSSQAFVLFKLNDANTVYTYKQAITETEHTMYDRIRSDNRLVFFDSTSLPFFSFYPTSVWINKVPCAGCIDDLVRTYDFVDTKPTVYVETLSFNETNNTQSLTEHLGCLEELEKNGFTVSVWDWSEFKTALSISDTDCTSAIQTATSASVYTTKKDFSTKIIGMIEQLEDDNNIQTWCPSPTTH